MSRIGRTPRSCNVWSTLLIILRPAEALVAWTIWSSAWVLKYTRSWKRKIQVKWFKSKVFQINIPIIIQVIDAAVDKIRRQVVWHIYTGATCADFKKELDPGGISCPRWHYRKTSRNQRSPSRKPLKSGLPSLPKVSVEKTSEVWPPITNGSASIVHSAMAPKAGGWQTGHRNPRAGEA
jgi:hypothetical protein